MALFIWFMRPTLVSVLYIYIYTVVNYILLLKIVCNINTELMDLRNGMTTRLGLFNFISIYCLQKTREIQTQIMLGYIKSRIYNNNIY